LIWVKREAEYFCEKGWTGQPLICLSGKLHDLSGILSTGKGAATHRYF
jgi:hypothetical protein